MCCVAFEFFACLILLFLYDNPCMRLSLLVRRVILAFTVISYAVSGTLVADPIQIDVKTGTDVKAATGIKEEYALNIIGDVTVKATELNSVWGTYDELFFGSDYTISSEDGQSSLHFSGKSRTGLEKLFYDCNVMISNLKDVSISDHYNMASTPDYEHGTWSQPWNYTAREFGALINSTVVVKDLGGSFTIQNNSTESSHWAISQGDATVNGGLLNIYGSFINISGGVNITNNYVKEAPTISHLIGKFVDREFYVYGGMGDVANLKFMGNRTGIHIDGNYVYQEFFRGTEGQGYGGAFCLSGAEGTIFSGNAGLLSVSDNYLHMATIAQGGAFYLWPSCELTITGQQDATDNDFSGGVDLQQGTLRLRADNALGNSALKTESGTTLVVENEADVALDFTAEDSPLKSEIHVDTGASLTLAGNYIASSSVSLAGNGKLRFNAENGQILFSSMAAFDGELSAVAAGSGVSVESGYSGAAALRVVGAEAQMSFAGDVLLEHGGSLQVAENAVFAIDSITGSLELASGATLHAGGAAIAAASSLALEDVACPALAVQHVELCGGSTYVQDGAYFTLTGDTDSLAFKGDGVIRLKTTLDYTVTEDGLHRFILFDGVEESITLSDSVSFSIVGYEGLEANVVQVGSSVYLQVVPEPATATLGLLALVALSARRRRK